MDSMLLDLTSGSTTGSGSISVDNRNNTTVNIENKGEHIFNSHAFLQSKKDDLLPPS